MLNIWKAVKELKDQIKALEDIAHEPQNYKKKCDEMEKRIKALEKKVHMIR
jgi:peptidoglycan hydrolase CwlO-like protein